MSFQHDEITGSFGLIFQWGYNCPMGLNKGIVAA